MEVIDSYKVKLTNLPVFLGLFYKINPRLKFTITGHDYNYYLLDSYYEDKILKNWAKDDGFDNLYYEYKRDVGE